MMQMFYSYDHIINTVYQLYELSLLLIILLKCPLVQDLLSSTSMALCGITTSNDFILYKEFMCHSLIGVLNYV